MRDLAQLIAEDENFCKVFDAKKTVHKSAKLADCQSKTIWKTFQEAQVCHAFAPSLYLGKT